MSSKKIFIFGQTKAKSWNQTALSIWWYSREQSKFEFVVFYLYMWTHWKISENEKSFFLSQNWDFRCKLCLADSFFGASNRSFIFVMFFAVSRCLTVLAHSTPVPERIEVWVENSVKNKFDENGQKRENRWELFWTFIISRFTSLS